MARGRVIVVGSVNADLVVTGERLPRAGETVTGGKFARHGGGKGANQAVAAARLGAQVALAAAVGADGFGDEALRELAAEGVDVSAVARLDGVATGVAAIMVDRMGENQIAVASGANAALDGDAVEAALARLMGSGSPAGVVLLGHEVPEEAVVAGARLARAAGWVVVLNPAPARPLATAVLESAPIVTPNADEARALTGEQDIEAAGRALNAKTGAPVLVTLGERGALLIEAGRAERLPALPVTAVDTTGAGDTVNGALAAQLAAGADLKDAARFALTAAALSTRAAGARSGMPRHNEVLAVL
jgi:ribokinase